MKKKQYLFSILALIMAALIFSAGYYVGSFREHGLTDYVELFRSLGMAEKLEQKNYAEIKRDLDIDINQRIIFMDALNEIWLLPIEEKALKGAHNMVLQYRINNSIEYTEGSPGLIFQTEANKVLNK